MAAQELTKTVLKDNANLKAYYRFESGALTTDSSGNSVTLTNNGTVVDGTGIFGGAADLGASNSTKSLTSTNTLSINGGAISMCGWFKLNTEIGSSTQILLGHLNNTSATYERIVYDYNGGTRRLLFYRTKPGVADQGPAYTVTLGTSNWVHLAFTYDATNVRGYVNGACIGTVAASGNGTGSYTQGIFIGQDQSGGNQPSALIDDVAFFNVALSADQIKELYEGRFVGEAYPQAGLVAGYHLSSETDFSGNNYHLTNNASTAFIGGKFKNCANFNGTTQSLSINNSFGIDGGACSISAWINPTTVTSASDHLSYVALFGNTTKTGCNLFVGTTGIGATRLRAGVAWDDGTQVAITAGVWVHAVLTYDTSNLKLYINGNLRDSRVSSGSGSASATSKATLGCRADVDALTGQIATQLDEVLFFNTVLSAQQIRRRYAQGVGKLE